MKTRTLILIAGASALAVAGAVAGEKKGDADWKAELETKFTEIDANSDGNMSGEEFLAYKQAQAEKEWTKWAEVAGDDGLVSLEEAMAHYEAKKAEEQAMKDAAEEEHAMAEDADEEGEGDQ